MDTERKDAILAERRDLMAKSKYDESKVEQFCDTVSDILQDCVDHVDDPREITYEVEKHLDCIAFRLNVSGSRIDPLTEGKGAQIALGSQYYDCGVDSVLSCLREE